MGHLTTIVIHNDLLGKYENDPTELGRQIIEGINRSNINGMAHGKGSGILVYPSRHADDETVYIHSGNTVTNLNV